MKRSLRLFALCCLAGCRTSGSAGLSPLEEAHVLLERGDGVRALPILEKLSSQAPRDLSIARMLAQAHVKTDGGNVLLASLRSEDTAISHYLRGLVLFSKATDASGPAITEFRQAVALEPGEPEFRYRLGIALLESEQFEAARVELESVAATSGNRTAWLLPLAKARYRTGDSGGATEAIRQLVTSHPTPAEAQLAKALMEQIADPFGALPRSARAKLEQAMAWLEGADVPQQAIVALDELLHEHPDEAVLHALLGLAWARLDDAGHAVEELKRAIELAPADGKNHLYLAQIYETRARPQQAEKHYRQALQFNPVLDQAWLKLGEAALNREDLSAAEQHFEVATRLSPQNVPARGKLALVHQLAGNWPAAERDLKAVLEQNPDNVEFMLRLGVLHTEHASKAKAAAERASAAAEAKRWLRKVLDVQPENAIASRALQRLK